MTSLDETSKNLGSIRLMVSASTERRIDRADPADPTACNENIPVAAPAPREDRQHSWT